MPAYKARSLAGAEHRIRELQRQIETRNALLDRWNEDRKLLAKLAATGPAFLNPLEAMAAEKLRNQILDQLGLRPDGTPK